MKSIQQILAVSMLLCMFNIQASFSSSQGVFELKLKAFTNKLGEDSNGHCCDGFRASNRKCSGLCRTKFRVCLKHYQSRINVEDECTFGEVYTQILGNNNIFVRTSPIQFPLDFKWPGTFSLIIEALHDNGHNNSDTLISRMATQNQLEAGSAWTHGVHQGSESHTRLEYEYRMMCSAHYYGKDCDTLCRPRDDQFGHYICDKEGNKMCLDGWQKDSNNEEGDYCNKAVCAPGCHNEHGYCDRPGECKCRDGWTGESCNECVKYPGCQHGTCNEPWTCHCEEGWGGLFCNQDLNYCTNNPTTCQNGATCFNTGQGSYTCSCSPGWTGKNCEIRITNECSHNLCVNGGTCQGTGENNSTCVCPLGFHGIYCELIAQTCSDNPCKNGAYCQNTKQGYECRCQQGFTGINCDVKMTTCQMNRPCHNGGTCLDGITANENDYQCVCPKGFAGANCETNIDDCALNPCQHGGTCIDFVDDYKCYCLPGFSGTHCEENVNECAINPCANGGTCHDSVNDFQCACPPGFTGKDCSIEINECASNPCMNGGFCTDKRNAFECKCLPNYSGKYCHILPDGTVMPLTGSNKNNNNNDSATLIAVLVTLFSLVIVLAGLLYLCRKKRRNLEQKRANDEAKRENELNAVSCDYNPKKLDYNNDLDYPITKKINGNPNLASDVIYQHSKEGANYKQVVNKQLNTAESSRASLLLAGKLDNESVYTSSSVSTTSRTLNRAALSQFNSDCSSSTSSTGAPSVCSSDSHPPTTSKSSVKNKKYDLPTAASIQAMTSRNSSRYGSDELFATEV